MRSLIVVAFAVTACSEDRTTLAIPDSTTLAIANDQTQDTTVYVTFGSNSYITQSDWGFCAGSKLACTFALVAGARLRLPNPNGVYISATFSFGRPVECGITKAEVNLNNPLWYDVADISLVDGFSNSIQIDLDRTTGPDSQIGPVYGSAGNASLMGVFPYGCDICVDRKNPPCGIPIGKNGCKAGTQYDPQPPCQWQGVVKGGGDLDVTVRLMRE